MSKYFYKSDKIRKEISNIVLIDYLVLNFCCGISLLQFSRILSNKREFESIISKVLYIILTYIALNCYNITQVLKSVVSN